MARLGHHDAAWERVKDPDMEVQETISGDDWIVFDPNKGRVEPYVAPRIYPKEGT